METKGSYDLIGENRERLGIGCGPSGELSGLIERFWLSERSIQNKETFEILPDGNFDLVFILNDSAGTLLFAGPYTRAAVVPIWPGKEYFGVRFRPGRMPRLADIQSSELLDTLIELPEMLGISTDTLSECLLGARGLEAKRAFMEQVFRRAGLESVVQRDLCSRCAEIVESCNGRIKVNDLAYRVGTGIRTLERSFIKNLGISPKMFIRLVRFQNVVEKLRNGEYSNLTNIAYDCGYTDQSHFIKDFQALSGRLPSSVYRV